LPPWAFPLRQTTFPKGGSSVSILWIILIIVLVLLLLGFFSRGRW
jgi:flagellar basal body-associated protein FliL